MNRLARLAKIGGHSRIESRAGVGTTVSLRLPLPKTAAGDGETANTTYG